MRADKPGSTATLIAAGVSFCARDPGLQPLIPPLAAQASDWLTRNASPHGRWLLRAMDKRWFRS